MKSVSTFSQAIDHFYFFKLKVNCFNCFILKGKLLKVFGTQNVKDIVYKNVFSFGTRQLSTILNFSLNMFCFVTSLPWSDFYIKGLKNF